MTDTTAPDARDALAGLPYLQPQSVAYDAYVENEPGWDGEGMYADLETAQRYSEAEYVLWAGTDTSGPLTWRHQHTAWDLLDNGKATGIIIAARNVFGTPLSSDEQQPADVVTAEQQQDGAVDLREHVRAWMDGRTDAIDRDDVREIYVVADRASRDLAGAVGELRRVLAERTALAARVAELESERNRYRIAWRRARQRARVAGWAADRYAKRSRDLHEAAMDMLTENLGLKMFGPEAVAEADRIAALAATETEES